MAKFKSVAEAAAALAENPKVKQSVEHEINCAGLIATLLELRVSKGLTQQQMAEAMGCDASKVSRMEAGHDFALKWADIVGYLGALNVGLHMVFEDPSLPAADRIKQHVFRIHDDLEKLAALAKQVGGEDEIAKKIHQFYGEVLINFLVRYKQNFNKLCAVVKVDPKPKLEHSAEAETTPAKTESDQQLACK